MRRSQRHELAEVGIPDIRNAFVQTIAEGGKFIDDTTAMCVAEHTHGFPYMVQLVGHYLWRSSESRHSSKIEACDLERALPDSVRAFEDAVCFPTFRGLSKAQKKFVIAMHETGSEWVTLSDVAKRAQRSEGWARKYRKSLLDAQVIQIDGDGSFCFSIPHFSSYLTRTLV